MEIETRRYINSFIEIKVDEIETTCYDKKQAEEQLQEFKKVVQELELFIEEAKD